VTGQTIAACGYAAFLLLFALGLDLLGRHTHDRSSRFRNQGFTYHAGLDVWRCPEGEELRPFGTDHHRRIARYRARPIVCNHCPAKDGCTDSNEGREVVRPLDPWPHSEAGRFHRGISVVLLLIASMIALAGMLVTPSPPDLWVLGVVLLTTVGVGLRLALAFSSTPSGFPDEEPRRRAPIRLESKLP
jgi:hypothetical protein